MEIAGRVLTNYLQKLLLERSVSLSSETVRDIKEKLCYAAQNYDEEKAAANTSSEFDQQYTFPDKNVLTVPGHVRMTCPELLFKPELYGKTCDSLHQLAWKSIQGSEIDTRSELYKNIILSGGNTMYEGIADRLKNEINAPGIRVIANADRKSPAWIGAAILSFLDTFEDSWITTEDYFEHGAAIVHRKCA
jgi:actin, other eukaryote